MTEQDQPVDREEEHEASADPAASLSEEWPLLDEETRLRRFQFLPRAEADKPRRIAVRS